MKHNAVWFVVVLFHPNLQQLNQLKKNLADYSVIYIDNTADNIGYGAGANAGIAQALKNGAHWVVVLNQDITVTKNAIQQFVDSLKTPGIYGPFGGALDFWRWTSIFPASSTDYISGSILAIHKDVFARIGLFYEPYFMYYEDVDFCIRAKKAGIDLGRVKVAGISHTDGTNEYYLARNHFLLVERHAPYFVKLYEYIRLPKTIYEFIHTKNMLGLRGLKDYFMRRFGAL